MSLTSKQRAALRGMANTMEPVFQIGKGEIDETLIKGVDDCIKARELIKLKVLEFVLWAEHVTYENSGKVYHFRSRQDYLPSLLAITQYEDLRKWYIDKITQACRTVMTRKEEQSSSIIDRAKDYIAGHYSKDISLDDVSREVDISPYYFSKVFKEATGENFIEYLTNVRISKAKEMLHWSAMGSVFS